MREEYLFDIQQGCFSIMARDMLVSYKGYRNIYNRETREKATCSMIVSKYWLDPIVTRAGAQRRNGGGSPSIGDTSRFIPTNSAHYPIFGRVAEDRRRVSGGDNICS